MFVCLLATLRQRKMTEVIAMALGGGSTLQWGVDRGLQHLLLM